MTALTADRAFQAKDGYFQDFPVEASEVIYKGAIVGDNGAGYAQALASGDPFLGIAIEQADNSSGSAGDINCVCRRKGIVRFTGQSGFSQTDVGTKAYAHDDGTVSATKGSKTFIGYFVKYESASVMWVDLMPDANDEIT